MTAVFGNLSLALAVVASLVVVLLGVAGARLGSESAIRAGRWVMIAVAGLLTLASGMLLAALVDGDFRFSYVTRFTERALPLGYKLAAFWAGQEGSILLWAWLIAVMAVVMGLIQGRRAGLEPGAELQVNRAPAPTERLGSLPDGRGSASSYLVASGTSLATLGAICAFFAALMVFAGANPFILNDAIPVEGHGLNPLLQDPAMIAHPPTLFIGYAGFAIPFAMFIGAMIANRTDNYWIVGIRRWILFSWLFLTIGIVLGAWWAYIELGWGGYWAWDPVENASLLPWLTATALLHSVSAQQQRGTLKVWNGVLICLCFALTIFGTFITRSGVVESVHSFGKSLIGTFFLGFLLLCVAFSAVLMIVRGRALRSENSITNLLSRDGAFLAANVLLTIMMLTTAVGTIFPVISGLFMAKGISVSQPFYNKIVVPMSLLLVGLMALGPLLSYGVDAAERMGRRLILPAGLAIAGLVALWALGVRNPWALAVGAIASLALSIILVDVIQLDAFRGRRYVAQLAHLGVLMMVVGIAGSSIYGAKRDLQVAPGQSVTVGDHTVLFKGIEEIRGTNYSAVEATVVVTDSHGAQKTLRPQRRFYDRNPQSFSDVDIESSLRGDFYVALAGWENGGNPTALQVIINPLVAWIWIGGIVMAVGGILAMLPRFLPVRAESVAAPPPLPLMPAQRRSAVAEREWSPR